MVRGILEKIDAERWRLTVDHDDDATSQVFDGPLRLLLDVIDDLAVDVREVKAAREHGS